MSRCRCERVRRELRGIRRGISVAVICDGLDPQAGQLAVFLACQFSGDVVITREGIRLEFSIRSSIHLTGLPVSTEAATAMT